MKKTKLFLLLMKHVFVLLAGFLVLQACTPKAPPPDQKKNVKSVRTIPAETRTISLLLTITGTVEPVRVANLASPAQGPVRDCVVREGDHVQAGQVLLSIGRAEGVTAMVTSLEEELKKEEDNLRRTQQLVESGAVAGEMLDQARTNYEKVKAQLINARETALDYSITAPWAGIASRVHVKDGDFVVPRAPLLEIYDPGTLVIRAAVPEQHAVKIHRDMPVKVKLDAFEHQEFSAHIFRIYPYLDRQTRTRTIEIKMKNDVHFLPGMFARLEIVLEQVETATVVPTQAVSITPQNSQVVFTVKDNIAFAKKVITGIEEGNLVQIVSGIQPGEMVVVAGNETLKDGDHVKGPTPSEKKRTGAEHEKDTAR